MRGSDVDQAAACLLRFYVNVRAAWTVSLDRPAPPSSVIKHVTV